MSEQRPKIDRLLALANDPGATPAEAESAVVMALRIARRDGLRLGVEPGHPTTTRSVADVAVMPWGKHRGKTLREVAMNDPSYAEWLVWECEGFHRRHPLYRIELAKLLDSMKVQA